MTIRRNTLLVFGAILFCLIVAVWQVGRVRAGSSSHGKTDRASALSGDNEHPVCGRRCREAG